MIRRPPRSTLFPSPPLSRPPGTPSPVLHARFLGPPHAARAIPAGGELLLADGTEDLIRLGPRQTAAGPALLPRSEEHTSELQSPCNLVCRLLLEKKKTNTSS